MYFLYTLKSLKDGKLYIGVAKDPHYRLAQHNKGYSLSTKHRRPLILIYIEQFDDKSKAMKREWYFKNTSEGNILMRKLIEREAAELNL